ncbi:TIGR02453 family protein [Zhengella sp. ZM62]|uniref:TIGR02453 family protein n=1 Tax=Zhengella sedimenti TaxID=3390035 RepID=UPI003974BF81
MSTFHGFGEKAIPFLKALDFHQDRDWFKENRDLYESELNGPRGALILDLTVRFAEAGLPYRGDPKKSVFRIYRDIRFSKDKRPFNRHVSIILTPDGTKRSDGCFYLHVGLEGCFMAVAFYSPAPDALKRMRNSIIAWPERYRTMVGALASQGLELDSGEALKRLPRGFETVEEEDLATGVKKRHFITREEIDPTRITSPELADDCVDFAKRAHPLFEWGIGAI